MNHPTHIYNNGQLQPVSAIAERLYDRQFFDLMEYINTEYSLLDAAAVMTRMRVDLRRCNAVTETGFIKWAYAYVRQTADDLLKNQVSSIDEVVALAKHFDTDERRPFVTQQHPLRPDITFVQVLRGRGGRDSHIWIVPTDKLGLVQILHPTVEVRFTRIANRRYAYLIKRCRQQTYNGSWVEGVERDLLGIWMGTDWPIEAKDRNYLNYLPENLIIDRPREDALDRAVHELWPDKDARPEDWKPDAPTAVPPSEDTESLSAGKPKPPSVHDIKVKRWLGGDDKLKGKNVTKDAQAAETASEVSEAFIAQAAVDIAVRQLRQSWGVRS